MWKFAETSVVGLISDARCPFDWILSSDHAHVARVAQLTIDGIVGRGSTGRSILRGELLAKASTEDRLFPLLMAAIPAWLAQDLIDGQQFDILAGLARHPAARASVLVLEFLNRRFNDINLQFSLVRAGILSTILSLIDSDDHEIVALVSEALNLLAVTLTKEGHISEVVRLLSHPQSSIQDAAGKTLLRVSCSNDELARDLLVSEGIIERVIFLDVPSSVGKTLSRTIVQLAVDYVRHGRAQILISLVE